ncbi:MULTISPECIES: type II toxin-antitoxin system VapC family toxin [unclassified Endozoicomonas]|uniref:type II toxin-antitoxin system VapC family toxin n=1 Tax=unclassified Endozoicomonas TaxID=2644528 RepID=UPI0021489479
MIILDTHVLIFDAIAPDKLSAKAHKTLEAAREKGELAYCDISMWEISMLLAKKRLTLSVDISSFLKDVISANRLTVLPISPEIAKLSISSCFSHKDPADRLIGATAIYYQAYLVTCDSKLTAVRELKTLW